MTNETQPITGSGTAEHVQEAIVVDAAQSATLATFETTEPTAEIETKTYGDGTVATGVAPLPETSPIAVETTNGPLTLQPVGEQILAGTPEHHSLLAEIEAMGESMEASLAEALRTRCAALRRALGL